MNYGWRSPFVAQAKSANASDVRTASPTTTTPAASLPYDDSDGGSGVMVRLQSQESTHGGQNKHAPRSADWVIVDEESRSLGSSTVNVQAPSPNTVDMDANAAEQAQLAAALEASQKDQRERDVERMREDRQMQKAIEASKMEAVAYALSALDAEPQAEGATAEVEESDETDSTTGWTSSDDDNDEDDGEGPAAGGDEDVTPHTDAEIRQHTIERLRVLEAAGVLVKADDASAEPSSNVGYPDEHSQHSEDVGTPVARKASKAVRRPPPPPGQKRHKNIDELVMLSRSRTGKRPPRPEEPQRRKPPQKPRRRPSRELPAIPVEGGRDPAQSAVGGQEQNAMAPEDRMEDAYDRYLKLTKEVSLQPILPATASGAAANNATIPPSSPPPFAAGAPARPSSAAGDGSSRTSGFLSTIKSMSHRSAWTGSSAPSPRPDSGFGNRLVSGPIALGSGHPSAGLLQAASISEPQRNSGESSDAVEPSAPRAGAPSWSSLVGPELLSGLSDTERKRQEAIFELISTETAHVRDLQIIVEVFFNSMQSMLSEKASTVIFANIESVLFAAVTYLSDLEARQKEDRLFVTSIGDVLERHMPAMSVYLPYCVNQQSAGEILEAERKRDTRIDIHLLNLRTNHPAARGLDLSHFLLVPMQRLTRYPLLLGQILRYTPEDHVDHVCVKRAKETAESILAKTNEAIRENEDASALAKLSENLWLGEEARLDLTKPFVDPAQPDVKRHRRVLRDEMVSKSKSGRKLRLVLTTDLLLVLHAQDSSLYRMPIPVKEVTAQEAKSKSARHADAFTIVHSMPAVAGAASQADTLKLRAPTPRNAQAWIRIINAARADAPNAKA